jgi:hypothetical protein
VLSVASTDDDGGLSSSISGGFSNIAFYFILIKRVYFVLF